MNATSAPGMLDFCPAPLPHARKRPHSFSLESRKSFTTCATMADKLTIRIGYVPGMSSPGDLLLRLGPNGVVDAPDWRQSTPCNIVLGGFICTDMRHQSTT